MATTGGRSSSGATFQVEVGDGTGRIHLPASMIPPVNSGGVDGWWSLTDVVLADDQISGRFRVNIFNKPSFQISRVTGDMDMRWMGSSSFHGSCQKLDPAQRAF